MRHRTPTLESIRDRCPSARILGACLATVATACMVGPNYVKPEVSMPEAWIERSPDSPPSDAPADVARWWTAFGDATLDSLVERTLSGNLDLQSGEAALRRARAARTFAAGGKWPSLDANADATRSGVPEGGASQPPQGDLFRVGFDALWELDLFGGTRRGVEAAEEDVRASAYDLSALQVSLAAEVATTYFDLRAAQDELAIARENLVSQQETVELTRQRFDRGLVSELDVDNARAQADGTSASIPSIEAQERAAVHALELLLGREPGALLDELSKTGSLPSVVPAVPLGLPSDLLRRRPDIAREEAALHAATARIGVAVADLYPSFSLNGSLGLAGGHASSLFHVDDRFWTFGLAANLPLFNAGRLHANVEAQEASRDQALVAYQKTILTALQEVETAFDALARERERQTALVDALRAQDQALALATELYRAGRIDFLNVLSAQSARLSAQLAVTDSSHAIALDLAALYKALGGGWEPGSSEPASQTAEPAPHPVHEAP